MQTQQLGNASELLRDLRSISRNLTKRRRIQLYALLVLQIVGAGSEAVSIGAILPFLNALANANALLTKPILKPWLDLIGVNTAAELITFTAFLFAMSIVFVNLLRITILWVQSRLTSGIGADFNTEIYRRILFQPYSFHTKSNSSTTISVLTNDFGLMMVVVRNFLIMIMQGLVVLAIVGALVAYNAPVALILAALLLVAYIIISKVSKEFLLRNGRTASNKYRSKMKMLQESIGGIRDIILDSNQHTFIKIFSNADIVMRRAKADSLFISTIPRYLLEIVGISILCGIATALAWHDNNFQKILPLMGGFSMAAIRLLPAIQRVYNSYADMQGAHISMKRALEAIERPIDSTWVTNPTSTYILNRGISIEKVWFSYSEVDVKGSEIDWVLRNINIVIPAYKTVALVGDTGSGKSTLADIILGLLRPQQGCIRIDDIVLTDENINNWRQSIAHVPQSIFLSDCTIKENIAFGIPVKQIDINRVKEVAQLAWLDDFIESRPLGYDEIVGERGIQLSGGQRQRIGIARALYKQTSIIVFDEATSSLDNTTEARVMDAINNLTGKFTMVIIAHRLTTIRSADVIYEICNGNVIGSGKYEELVENSETFRAMAKIIS